MNWLPFSCCLYIWYIFLISFFYIYHTEWHPERERPRKKNKWFLSDHRYIALNIIHVEDNNNVAPTREECIVQLRILKWKCSLVAIVLLEKPVEIIPTTRLFRHLTQKVLATFQIHCLLLAIYFFFKFYFLAV